MTILNLVPNSTYQGRIPGTGTSVCHIQLLYDNKFDYMNTSIVLICQMV